MLEARFRLEIELRRAIERKELTLAYQPQIAQDGQWEGVEVLLRWHHSQLGFISPADFIPIAESNGLILPLGQWVIEKACIQIARWSHDPVLGSLVVSVNVSSKQFHQPDFVMTVMDTVKQTGIDPARLCLEVTESMVLDDLDDAQMKMSALKGEGVKIAMGHRAHFLTPPMTGFGQCAESDDREKQLRLSRCHLPQLGRRRKALAGQLRLSGANTPLLYSAFP